MPQHTSTRQPSSTAAGPRREETEPGAPDPAPAEEAEAKAAVPEQREPEGAARETAEPEAAEPETAEPASVEAESTEAEAAEPESRAPERPEPQAAEADVTKAEVPDPEAHGSDAGPAPEPDRVSEPAPAPETDPAAADTARPARRSVRWPWKVWSAWAGRWRERHPAGARALSVTVTVLAAVLVVAALVMPNSVVNLGPAKFLRIPGEAVIGAAVMLALPRRPRVVLAAVSGVALGAMTLLNALDMGFNQYLGRSFNLVLDWSLLTDAESYLEDSLGRTATLAAVAGVFALVLLLFVLLALSTVRLSNLLARHTGTATRGTLIAGVVWITCTSLGLQVSGVPLASERTATALKVQARRVSDTLRDEAEFRKVARVDAFGNTPGSQLVPDLRGKDMIFTFIESYGRSAIEDPIMAPGVDRTLDVRTKALAAAGFHAKSGWLTSATYGGSSWLGHSTTMSGLWISNQQRYRTVMASDHMSLTDAFERTGAFDTVGVMPGVQKGWPEQKWYGLGKVYNAFQLGYKGPKFSWSTMPDQYALQQYQERVHSKRPAGGKSRMSLLILTSSHQPWAPIPKMVGWDQLGDGSVFKGVEAAGNDPADVIADTTKSREEYGKSVQYSVTALTEWLERYGTEDTVLVFLGDHQPIARVSGNHASRDVPVSIVAKDPRVLDKVADWHWTDGLRPAHDAPVWKMSSFRDRFLTAYGSTPHPRKG
ncbi:CDP-alcohol phosphatidyltransferase [Streptomyces sp. 1222.5]|uniref:CDP-alcohol phosphatidyltransferase n=1 Tax=Streptomyces sp. 1222.5 TaxID=1881026 RepID=UPI003D72719A